MQEEVELLEELAPPLDLDQVHRGELSPAFFGSAMNNFGVSLLPQPVAPLLPLSASLCRVPCHALPTPTPTSEAL